MRDRRVIRITAAPLLVLLLALAAPALANDTIAKIENAGEALIFHPIVEAERWVLTVAGPCNFRYEAIGKGRRLTFKLGEETANGRYSYSLKATRAIDPEIMEVLKEARASGEMRRVNQLCRAGRLPDPTQIQSDTFTVLDGRIVYDTVPEAERETDDDGGQAKTAGLAPEELAPVDRTGAEVRQAAVRPAPPTYSTAAAPAPNPTQEREPSCDWARMEPGAGVAER